MSVDAVILHTTLLCLRWSELFERLRKDLQWLSDLSCPKLAFPQDEYDHSELLDDWLSGIGITDVFSVFDEPKRALVYQKLIGRASFHKCFTGYIDDVTAREVSKRLVPTTARPNDVVYRASHLPYWFGSHGQVKHRIAGVVAAHAGRHGLRTDISTAVSDTILGERWFDFLMSGRTVLGCESGSSVLDRRGEMQVRIRRLLGRQPDMPFALADRHMPSGWDRYEFFALSPRHFESIITKTCQVLVEGDYEGVLKPERHYIPMKRDLSDVEETLDRMKDRRLTHDIAETAYEDIYLSGKYGYAALAKDIESVVADGPSGGRRSGCAVVHALDRLGGRALAERERRQRQREANTGAGLALPISSRASWARLRIRSRLATARRRLRMRLPWRNPNAWKILLAWVISPEARRGTGLMQLTSDLLKLELLRDTAYAQEPADFAIAMSYDPERGSLTFETYRTSDEGPHRQRPAVESPIPRGSLQSIVWNYEAMGHWTSANGSRSRRSRWLGPDGEYRFNALERLATSHHRFVREAFAGVETISHSSWIRRAAEPMENSC
jgi:hypothetical protein